MKKAGGTKCETKTTEDVKFHVHTQQEDTTIASRITIQEQEPSPVAPVGSASAKTTAVRKHFYSAMIKNSLSWICDRVSW